MTDMIDRKIIDILSAPLSDDDMEFLFEKGFALYKEHKRMPGARGWTIRKEDGMDFWVGIAVQNLLLSRLADYERDATPSGALPGAS